MATVQRRHRVTAATTAVYRGIVLNGGEFGAGSNIGGGSGGTFSNVNRGTYGTDYSYESQASLNYLYGRGVRFVRFLTRWERLQPTLGAALDSTEMTRVDDLISRCATAGLQAIFATASYGAYWVDTAGVGVRTPINTGTVTIANYVDFWDRISERYKNNPTVIGYTIEHEPRDMNAVAGSYTANHTYATFDATTESWAYGFGAINPTVTRSTTTTDSGAGSLQCVGTYPTGGFQNSAILHPSFASTDITSRGTTLRARVRPNSGTGSVTARVMFQDAAFNWYTGPDVALTDNVFNTVDFTPAGAEATAMQTCIRIAVDYYVTGGGGASKTVFIDNVTQGSVTGGQTAAAVWEDAAQQAVTAIRANGDTKFLLVPTYEVSSPTALAANHPAGPWIVDPANNFAYAVNYYPGTWWGDPESGTFSYADGDAEAIADGYASFQAFELYRAGLFTAWLNGEARGFIGEFGWPNSVGRPTDYASWDTLAAACIDYFIARGWGWSLWGTGELWQSDYTFGIYSTTGDTAPLNVARTSSAVMEPRL